VALQLDRSELFRRHRDRPTLVSNGLLRIGAEAVPLSSLPNAGMEAPSDELEGQQLPASVLVWPVRKEQPPVSVPMSIPS